jgi:hypothetical protein
VHPKQFLSIWYVLAQTVHLSCTDTNTAFKRADDPCHQRVPSGAFNMISKAMVQLVQIEHISYTDTNTVSKRTKMRFHMTHVSYEFHRVRLK